MLQQWFQLTLTKKVKKKKWVPPSDPFIIWEESDIWYLEKYAKYDGWMEVVEEVTSVFPHAYVKHYRRITEDGQVCIELGMDCYAESPQDMIITDVYKEDI